MKNHWIPVKVCHSVIFSDFVISSEKDGNKFLIIYFNYKYIMIYVDHECNASSM